jgi:hypothetical protein
MSEALTLSDRVHDDAGRFPFFAKHPVVATRTLLLRTALEDADKARDSISGATPAAKWPQQRVGFVLQWCLK